MFARLALLFIVVPLLELALLIQVGQIVGLMPTVLLVLATGFGGAALARREGLRTLAKIQSNLAQGRLPGEELMDGAAILFGGALLLTPGILTDFVGLALLFPVTRRWFARRLRASFERQIRNGTVTFTAASFRAPAPGQDGMGYHGDGAWKEDAPAQLGLDPSKEIRTDPDDV